MCVASFFIVYNYCMILKYLEGRRKAKKANRLRNFLAKFNMFQRIILFYFVKCIT